MDIVETGGADDETVKANAEGAAAKTNPRV